MAFRCDRRACVLWIGLSTYSSLSQHVLTSKVNVPMRELEGHRSQRAELSWPRNLAKEHEDDDRSPRGSLRLPADQVAASLCACSSLCSRPPCAVGLHGLQCALRNQKGSPVKEPVKCSTVQRPSVVSEFIHFSHQCHRKKWLLCS